MPQSTEPWFQSPQRFRTCTRDCINKLISSIADLDEHQQIGPYHKFLNPPLWEVTHALWFIERWVLRDVLSEKPYFDGVDSIYNSVLIRHGQRWANDLIPLSSVQKFADHLISFLDDRINDESDNELFVYRLAYSIYHADMHIEAVNFQRQGRGLSAPEWIDTTKFESPQSDDNKHINGDVEIEGGRFPLGSPRSEPFVFDNEKWAHEVEINPFSISLTPVTQGEYREFVDAGGYQTEEFWGPEAREWINQTGFDSPRYWKKIDGDWHQRVFDEWEPLDQKNPIVHVSYYEAQAYCRWADRRLPTEAEWELAATGWNPDNPGEISPEDKPRYPWGNNMPESPPANLAGNHGGLVPVTEFPDGDSPFGCRQMIGNVWEWTQTRFEPYEGFEPDFYKQYSEPWFGSRYCHRGGSWCTQSRLIRTGYRNFATPDRNDRFLGFRTCAV